MRRRKSDKSGWASLDFSDAAELNQLRRLRESPDYELCQLSEKKPGWLDELAAERAKMLEKENADLQTQADKLAEEIKEWSRTEAPERIAWIPTPGNDRRTYKCPPHPAFGHPLPIRWAEGRGERDFR